MITFNEEEFSKKVELFEEIFLKFNKIHNLSAYKNLANVARDSIFPLCLLEQEPKCVIDIGSGAGIPAVFLSFVLKDCMFYLFEPACKKSSFLSFAKVALKLENIIIHNQKIQNSPKFRADVIASRATFKIYDLIALSKGFYDLKSKFLLYKGSNVENELKNINAKSKILKQNNMNYVLLEGVQC